MNSPAAEGMGGRAMKWKNLVEPHTTRTSSMTALRGSLLMRFLQAGFDAPSRKSGDSGGYRMTAILLLQVASAEGDRAAGRQVHVFDPGIVEELEERLGVLGEDGEGL